MEIESITEARRGGATLEAALRESERKYQELVKYAPAGIYEVDFRTKRYLSVNDAMCRISGYSREELLAMSPFDLLDERSREVFQARVDQWLRGEKPDPNVDYRVITKDGREIYALLDVSFTVDENGRPKGATVVAQDITERKRAEEALRESEERYRGVIQNTSAIILRVDPQGIIRFANKRALAFFGYEEGELIGKHALGTIIPAQETAGRDLTAMVRDITAEPDRFHTNANENMRKSGERVWMEWTNSGVYDGEDRLKEFFAVGIDVTDRKKTEEALRESEARLAELSRNLSAEMEALRIFHQINTRYIRQEDIHGIYKEILDAAMELTNADCGTLQLAADEGHSLELIAHAGLSEAFTRHFERVSDDKAVCGKAMAERARVIVHDALTSALFGGSHDRQILLNEGICCVQSTPMFSGSGNLVGMLSTCYKSDHEFNERELRIFDLLARQAADVIERVKMEEALQTATRASERNELLLKSVIQQMPVGVTVTDDTGTDAWNNAAMDRIWGRAIQPDENIYNHRNIAFHQEGAQYWYDEWPLYRSLATGEPVIGEEMKFLRGDGAMGTLLASSAAIKDGGGKAIAGIAVESDITELRQAQEELLNLSAKILSAEREKNEALRKTIDMKDDFLLTISHEFKTPLSVINSAIQTMELTCAASLNDRIKKYLNIIKQNSNRQLRLVNNLLDVTRMNAGRLGLDRTNVDVVGLTASIVESIRAFTEEKGILLSLDSTTASMVVGLDEAKYERILLNLLSNVVKFTPAGKAVGVAVSRRTVKGVKRLCLTVRDEGVGIPLDKQGVLFQKFGQVGNARTKQAEGTGIGLYLVKLLVELMGGEIGLASEPGAGSTFTVLLPAGRAPDSPDGPAARGKPDNRLAQATALEFSDVYCK